jgi:hypothetical protein
VKKGDGRHALINRGVGTAGAPPEILTHTSAPVPLCDGGAPSPGTSPPLQCDLPLRRFSVAGLQPPDQRASRERGQRISVCLSRPLANSLIHGVPVLLLSSCQGARASRHRRDLIVDDDWSSELTVDFWCCRAAPAILLCLVAGDRLHVVRVLLCSESCRGKLSPWMCSFALLLNLITIFCLASPYAMLATTVVDVGE